MALRLPTKLPIQLKRETSLRPIPRVLGMLSVGQLPLRLKAKFFSHPQLFIFLISLLLQLRYAAFQLFALSPPLDQAPFRLNVLGLAGSEARSQLGLSFFHPHFTLGFQIAQKPFAFVLDVLQFGLEGKHRRG